MDEQAKFEITFTKDEMEIMVAALGPICCPGNHELGEKIYGIYKSFIEAGARHRYDVDVASNGDIVMTDKGA